MTQAFYEKPAEGRYHQHCFLARYGVMENEAEMPPCEGRLVRAHLLPRQRMRLQRNTIHHMARHETGNRAKMPKTLAEYIADPRSWVWACGGPSGNAGHHGMLDISRKLRLPADVLPPGLWELAEELQLVPWLIREYGFPSKMMNEYVDKLAEANGIPKGYLADVQPGTTAKALGG